MQQDTKDTEQSLINRSYDPTYNMEVALLVGEDAPVLRRVQVNSSGYIKVSI
jgi:pyruvate dehydrogenase complex dehydrogenase (E1) component